MPGCVVHLLTYPLKAVLMITRANTLCESVLDVIGNTPLVELSRLARGMDGRILAKLDYLNPGHSKKERIALQIIEDALAAGELAPGQTVVEMTSGNTGTGLAIVCAVKGHPFVAVMSRGNSEERARMMSALGADVVLVDQMPSSTPGQVCGGDLELVELKAKQITEERNGFWANQFGNPANFRAHYLQTGPEILEQTAGEFDVFCDFLGSGGSFAGCAAIFKEHNPNIRCYVVEPATAAAYSGKRVINSNHRIQGGGYARPDLPLMNREHVDGYLTVTDEQAVEWTRRLAREEGIFAGFSTGANLHAAWELLGGSERGKTVVILVCDSGLKYLSTNLWK